MRGAPWHWREVLSARRRVLLYSHDTFGLGHLRRNLAIAEHLRARDPGFDVWLLTGSPVIRSWVLPTGLNVQQLPPVVKLSAERYAPRGGGDPFSLVKGYREALILKAVLRERPDVVLVDHAPAGMKGELLPTLALLRRELPATRVVLGLRDILDSPDIVRALWQDEGVYELLEHAYDRILVYGSPDLFDVVRAYAIPERVARKLTYAGYVGRQPRRKSAASEATWAAVGPRAGGPRVLVTAGGGGDGMFLMEAYLRALAMLPEGLTSSLIVTGPLMPPEQISALDSLAGRRTDVAFLTYTFDLPELLVEADVVVSMGGYNTSVEILSARKNAIIIPRAAPREEQRLRASLLARLGLVWSAEPGADLAGRLASLLPEALANHRPRPPAWSAIDLDGASRVGDALEEQVCCGASVRYEASARSVS
jgi:predicted glycosyltransferase